MKHRRMFAVACLAVCSVAWSLPQCGGLLTLGQTSLEIGDIDFRGVTPTTHYRPGRQKPGTIKVSKSVAEPALDDWLNGLLSGQLQRVGGSIQITGDTGDITRFELNNVLPTSWSFAACDVNATTYAGIVLELTGDITGKKGYDGYIETAPVSDWSPSNFRLSVDGMEVVTARATSIQPIMVSQTSAGDPDIDAAPVYESGDLVFTVPSDTARQIQEWLSDGGSVRAGNLTLFDSCGQVIRTITFKTLIADAVLNRGKGTITCRCITSNLRSEGRTHREP